MVDDQILNIMRENEQRSNQNNKGKRERNTHGDEVCRVVFEWLLGRERGTEGR